MMPTREILTLGLGLIAPRRIVDLDRSSKLVIFATSGKGKECLKAFKAHLEDQGGEPRKVAEVVCDMSPAFLSSATFSILPRHKRIWP